MHTNKKDECEKKKHSSRSLFNNSIQLEAMLGAYIYKQKATSM